jgi:hypothetical protein
VEKELEKFGFADGFLRYPISALNGADQPKALYHKTHYILRAIACASQSYPFLSYPRPSLFTLDRISQYIFLSTCLDAINAKGMWSRGKVVSATFGKTLIS